VPPSPGASRRRQSREAERRYRAREVSRQIQADTGKTIDMYLTHPHQGAPEGLNEPMTLEATAGHRPRLIIADDDPVIRSTLGMSLNGGFEVVGVAADTEEAIELARINQPDAAIVDVDMPNGGGIGAVRGILDVAPGTAIVVLSGDESDRLVRELMQAGAVAYRRKGLTPHVLAESLNESIKAHRDGRHGPC
jgi:CheY-like chemotaxis protein